VVWCAYGVLAQPVKVDKLVSLSINNFPVLLDFRDNTLSPEERLAPDAPGYVSPMSYTAAGIPKCTIDRAWKQHLETFKQRPVDQSRQRTVAARVTATAADASIASSLADRRRPTSLATLSDQPAAAPPAMTTASHIVEILRVSRARYYVQFSEPQGNPERLYVGRQWLNTRAEYADLVQRFWVQHEQKLQQSGVASTGEPEGEPANGVIELSG
jgi:hypothetical protein